MERVLSSQGFVKSQRLSAFLRHVVLLNLEGRDEELTEQLIGERVFERPAGYSPSDDNIVRSHASRLRQKLDAYFQDEGRDEPLRIVIPRGGYIPVFDRVGPHVEPEAAEERPIEPELPAAPPSTERSGSARWVPFVAGFGFCLLLALLFVTGRRWLLSSPASPATPSDRLWGQIFNAKTETLIVPADSGLVILKSITHRAIDPSEYASGRYLTDLRCEVPCDNALLQRLVEHRYTSVADLEFAVLLSRMPEALATHPIIRYARDLQMDDLKRSNLILIGSREANPWVEFFDQGANFILHDDQANGPLRVENRKPGPGEATSYIYDRSDPLHRGYAVVSFLPNLGGSGWVLLVQGFSLADTQAASEFVTSRDELNNALRTLFAKEKILPPFEVLLQTSSVNGMSAKPSVLSIRLHR